MDFSLELESPESSTFSLNYPGEIAVRDKTVKTIEIFVFYGTEIARILTELRENAGGDEQPSAIA